MLSLTGTIIVSTLLLLISGKSEIERINISQQHRTENIVPASSTASHPFQPVAAQSLYNHLIEVNGEWRRYPAEADRLWQPASFTTETERIQTHLLHVAHRLCDADVSNRSPRQQIARLASIRWLYTYANAGIFPHNYFHSQRIPVFIDPEGRACAVGYLMLHTGAEDLAREVARTNNNIHIRQINDARFEQWVESSGLSLDELALIQPGYRPENIWRQPSIAEGSVVQAFAHDRARGLMYVVGSFQYAGSLDSLGNVAAWNGRQWNALDKGVDGIVMAAIVHQGDLYIGGLFGRAGDVAARNIARWDGHRWWPVGDGLNDTVRAFASQNGMLYIGGAFGAEQSVSAHVTAWDGNGWRQFARVPDGPVDCLEAMDNGIAVAGRFMRVGSDSMQGITILRDGRWQPAGNGLNGSIQALAWLGDTLYAGGRMKFPGTKWHTLLATWDGVEWREFPLFSNEDLRMMGTERYHITAMDTEAIPDSITGIGLAVVLVEDIRDVERLHWRSEDQRRFRQRSTVIRLAQHPGVTGYEGRFAGPLLGNIHALHLVDGGVYIGGGELKSVDRSMSGLAFSDYTVYYMGLGGRPDMKELDQQPMPVQRSWEPPTQTNAVPGSR